MIGGEVNQPSWQFRGIRVSDFLPLSNSMQLIVRVSDYDPAVNITEAGFDRFFVSEGDVTGLPENNQKLTLYPNPFQDVIHIEGLLGETNFVLIDALGSEIQKGLLTQTESKILTDNLRSGFYMLLLNGEVHRVIKE